MSKQTANSFFMHPPSVEYAGFYQQLFRGIENYQHLGNRLVRLAEQAHAFRQFDSVKEYGLILSNIPLKHYQAAGLYYQAVATNNRGIGDQEKARRLFEQVANIAPQKYKAKAILSLAAVSSHIGDYESQFRFLLESAKASVDISTKVRAHLGLAIYKSMEGFSSTALKDFEDLHTLACLSEPIVYFDYLNSLAIVLGEAGRKEEARNIIKHVVASPFAFAYPEWQETARELKEPDRSSVAVPSIKSEPVEVQPIQSRQASRPHRPRRVIPFPPLKEVPKPNRPNPVTPEEFGDMTADERAELILAAVRSRAVKESEYVRLMLALGLLASGPASKVIDLEDESVLNDIISVWCNMIDAEEFASVMSALRDCKDDLRRTEIIDNMITIAFRQSPTSMQTEQEWRMRVERRLPEK